MSDARVYVLHVENERGFSSHSVALTVHGKLPITVPEDFLGSDAGTFIKIFNKIIKKLAYQIDDL